MEASGALGDIAFAFLADGGGDASAGGAVDAIVTTSFGGIEDALVVINMITGIAGFGDAFAGGAGTADPCAHEGSAIAVMFTAVFSGVGFANVVEDVVPVVALVGNARLIAADHLAAVLDIVGGADMAASAAVGVIGVPVDALTVAEAEGFVAGVFAFAVGADLAHIASGALDAAAFGRILNAFFAVEVITIDACFRLAALVIFANAVAGAFGEGNTGEKRAVDHPRRAFLGGIGDAFVVDDVVADFASVDHASAVEACGIRSMFNVCAFDIASAAVFGIGVEIDAELAAEVGALAADAVAGFAVLIGRADFAVIVFAATVAAFAVDSDERRDAFGGIADADASGGVFAAFASEEVTVAVFADDIIASEVDALVGFCIEGLASRAVHASLELFVIILIGEAVGALAIFPFPGRRAIDAAESRNVFIFFATAAAAAAATAFFGATPDADAVFFEIDVVDFWALDGAFACTAHGVVEVAGGENAASRVGAAIDVVVVRIDAVAVAHDLAGDGAFFGECDAVAIVADLIIAANGVILTAGGGTAIFRRGERVDADAVAADLAFDGAEEREGNAFAIDAGFFAIDAGDAFFASVMRAAPAAVGLGVYALAVANDLAFETCARIGTVIARTGLPDFIAFLALTKRALILERACNIVFAGFVRATEVIV